MKNNHIKNLFGISKFLVISFFIISSFFIVANRAYAETEISGNITTNTTWALANSPYIVTSTVQVLEGITLTIEPGVTVKFNNDTQLNIGGQLNAVGTSNQKILFTTNNPNPLIGNWNILFSETSVDASFDNADNYLTGSIIKYMIMEYGGKNSSILYLNKASPYISNNIFRNNNGRISGRNIGYQFEGGVFKKVIIENNEFTGYNDYIIYFFATNDVIIKNNTFTNNKGIIYLQSSVAKVLNNIFENNNEYTTEKGMFKLEGGVTEIKYNTFQNNNEGVSNNGTIFILSQQSNADINYNNIINNNFTYYIYNWQANNIDFTNNYYGTLNSTDIQNKIFDYYDNILYGKVFYEPFATAELDLDDQTAPTLAQITPVVTPTNDNTPDYIFSSTEAGTITYGGSCSSTTTVSTTGNNTITFNILTDGTYSNCTIKVTDAMGNESSPLNINTFVINTYVAPATLSNIAITTPATKLTYNVGDVLDITGLIVTGTYSDTTTKIETITTNNIIGFNSSTSVTDQILIITVNGKTTTYTIDIFSPVIPPTDMCPNVTGVQTEGTTCLDTLCLAPNTWNVGNQTCDEPAPTPVPGTWSTLPSCPTEPGTAEITFMSVCTPGPNGEACEGSAPTLFCPAVPPTQINGTWSAWTPATSECGTGTFTQTRECVGFLNGGTCLADQDGTMMSRQVPRIACASSSNHSGGGGGGNSSSNENTTAITPTTPTAPTVQVEGCMLGNLFSPINGKPCPITVNYTTPVKMAIPGCDNRTTGFSIITGQSCVGNTGTIQTAGQVLGVGTYHFTLLLKLGSVGNEVLELQKYLNKAGYDCGTPDGKFGPKTKTAVIKLQIVNRLKGDGVVGAITRTALNK